MDFKKEVAKLLQEHVEFKDIESLLEVPPDQKMGDYAFPCFALAKQFRKNPVEIARELKEKLIPNKYIIGITSAGPYLNFHINKIILAEEMLRKIYAEKQGYAKAREGKIVLVESPGPNTNKPLHIGHARNLCLGQCMLNLFRHSGNKVHHVDIVNDRGIHICKSMLAYQRWGSNAEPDMKPDHYVGKWYVLFNQKAKDDPNLEKEAQKMLVKWEKKDPEVMALWKKMNAWVYQGFNETYSKFNVKFDKQYYESEHYEAGRETILQGVKKGIFKKDEDGSIYIDLTEYGLSKKVLLRADGTSVYLTQDLNLAEKRYKEFKFDKCIYIVANEQIFHFKTLFRILETLKVKYAKGLYHLAYGMVNLTTGKMKSREGKVVDADDLIVELDKLAFEEIKKRHPELDYKEAQQRAASIAMSALRFYILKHDVVKDFVYDPKESISFEGETGPYVQYVYARISSILRKHEGKLNEKADYSLLKTANEQKLLVFLENFSAVIRDAKESYNPLPLTRYLIDLCQCFNEYYHQTPILTAEEKTRDARLMLIYCVREIVKLGLALLNIDVLEEM